MLCSRAFLPGEEMGQEGLWSCFIRVQISCPREGMGSQSPGLPQGAATRGELHRWPRTESGGWGLPWEGIGSWEGRTTAGSVEPSPEPFSSPP